MIITKTPFRMSFFGGGTDMENFFKENGGAVLSTTFDKYCYVNVRHLPRFFDYSTELSYSKTERVTNVDDIQHPAIRNAMKMLDMHEIRLTYEADLPARSGLGTSSSFAVGMLNAFYRLLGNREYLFNKEVVYIHPYDLILGRLAQYGEMFRFKKIWSLAETDSFANNKSFLYKQGTVDDAWFSPKARTQEFKLFVTDIAASSFNKELKRAKVCSRKEFIWQKVV